MISVVSLLWVFITVLITSIISGIIGMGGGSLLLAVMTLFFTLDVIIPIHGVIQLSANGSRIFYLRKNLVKEIIVPLTIGTVIGMIVGVYLKRRYSINDNYALGTIVLFIWYVVFKPKKLPHIQIPFWAFSIVGILTGLLAMFVGAVGPLLAVFFIRDDLTKEEIVANKSFSQAVCHLLKIPAFMSLGFDFVGYAYVWAPMLIASLLGTYIGVNALGKLDEKLFRKIFKVTLFIASVKIIHKILT
jgi:uncharacterized membrane protein YfcA